MKKLQPLFSCYPEVFVVFAISFLHGLAYWMVMYSSEILKVVKAPAGFTNAFFWGLYDTYMNCILGSLANYLYILCIALFRLM